MVGRRHPERFSGVRRKAALPLVDRLAWINEEVFAGVLAQRMAADLVRIARDWKLDVVVRELNEFGGYIAAEALGLPHATVQISAFKPFYWRDDALDRQLDRWRAEYGLASDSDLKRLYH
ncbi:MAG: hypothetical protein ACR2IK_14670 [Chloroflexota bacterium]